MLAALATPLLLLSLVDLAFFSANLWRFNPDLIFWIYSYLLSILLFFVPISVIKNLYRTPLKCFFSVIFAVVLYASLSVSNHVLVRKYLVDYSIVPSESMIPTFRPGNVIFYGKAVKVKRGDVGVWTGWNDQELMLKRIVALKGDRVSYNQTSIKLNGEDLKQEPCSLSMSMEYERLAQETLGSKTYCLLLVTPPGIKSNALTQKWVDAEVVDDYFIVGDNRSYSWDSRSPTWVFPITKENLDGIALGRAEKSLDIIKRIGAY